MTEIDYTNWDPESHGFKRVGTGNKYEGPCPFQPGSENTFYVNLDKGRVGCRKCAGNATGYLEDRDEWFKHVEAAGLKLKGKGKGSRKRKQKGEWEHWDYVTVDGKKRRQFRAPGAGKPWDNQETVKTETLQYVKYLKRGRRMAVVCEGASSAERLGKLGLSTVGLPTGRQTKESWQRLKDLPAVAFWPDKDVAGYSQAKKWAAEFGLACPMVEVWWIHPNKVNPLSQLTYDPGDFATDWKRKAVNEDDDAAAIFIEKQLQKEPPPDTDVNRVAGETPDETLKAILPAKQTAECMSDGQLVNNLVRLLDGRVKALDGDFYIDQPNDTWQKVHINTQVALSNSFNMVNADGVSLPLIGGSLSRAGSVVKDLAKQSRLKTIDADWDADTNVIGMLNGRVFDSKADQYRPRQATDMIRFRLDANESNKDHFNDSCFRLGIERLMPDEEVRKWIQKRLGKCVVKGGGLGHLLWFYEREGQTGKSTFIKMMRRIFGTYAVSIPMAEVVVRASGSHPEWMARIAGKRLVMLDEASGETLNARVQKMILGGEMVARHMYKGSFDFFFSGCILASANTTPTFSRKDKAMGQRLIVVTVQPLKAGETTEPYWENWETKPELEAAVWWLLQGVRLYHEEGIDDEPPLAIKKANREVWEETGTEEWLATTPCNEERTVLGYRAFGTDLVNGHGAK